MRGSGSDRPPRLGLDPSRPAPVRVARSGAPYLVPAAVVAVAALAATLGWDRIASCGSSSTASPDTQIRQALANQRRAHLADVYGFRAGGTAELYPLEFKDLAIAEEGGRATVAAMLDATGRVTWRDEAAELRYLGREKFHMRPCRIALWCGEGDQFERLRGVLAALFRRHDARIAEARAAGRPPPRIRAWQIRIEREVADVGEDREGAAGAERSVDRLRWDGGRWVFVAAG